MNLNDKNELNVLGQAVVLCRAQAWQSHMMMHYYQRNRALLKLWEPTRSMLYLFEASWRKLLKEREQLSLNKQSAHWVILSPQELQVIGCINLARLPFSLPTLNLGYSMDQDWQRRGIMSHVLDLVVEDAFSELEISEVEASCLPENTASQQILKRLGFTQRIKEHGYRTYDINGISRKHMCFHKAKYRLSS